MANLPKNEVTVTPQKVIKIPQFSVIPSPQYSTSPKKPWFSREIPHIFGTIEWGVFNVGDGSF